LRLNRLFVYLLFSTLFITTLQASFFGDLFGEKEQATPTVTQEEPRILIEEDVSIDQQMDRADQSDNKVEFADENIYIESDIGESSSVKEFEDSPKAFDEQEEITFEEELENDIYVESKTIFLSYVDQPKKIYLSQHIRVKVKAIVTNPRLNTLTTQFLNSKNVEILNPNRAWKKVSGEVYQNSFIYKIFSTGAKLPDIMVTASQNSRSKSEKLKSFQPDIVALYEDAEFCRVLSHDFTIVSHTEKKYDEKSNIVVMEISANSANLEDFHIPYAIKDGIDKIYKNENGRSIYYFAIVPKELKKFKFKYFDLVSNKYNIVTFPIELVDSSISTQTDLNPQKNKYILYRAIAIFILGLIVLIFYFKSKNLFLLFLALVIFLYLIYSQVPISKATLNKGVELKILPTENSTIFYKVQEEVKADILLKKDGYIKVLLPNKKIGWIKSK
jgi:hypothetical protein